MGEANERSHLLCIRVRGTFFTLRIVATVEITYKGNPQIRVVVLRVRSLASLRSSFLNSSTRQDQVMIGDVINMTETGDFKTFCGVIFVNFFLIPWRCTFIRKNRRVVNYNAGWDYCVKERGESCQRLFGVFLAAIAQGFIGPDPRAILFLPNHALNPAGGELVPSVFGRENVASQLLFGWNGPFRCYWRTRLCGACNLQ